MGDIIERIPTKQFPSPFPFVTIEVVKDVIYMFGSSGCYTIEISKLQEWAKFSGMGLLPKDREQLTATLTGARLFLFGGKDKSQQIIDDFSMLNTEFKAWAKPKPQGTAPTPRYGHTTNKNANHIFIFGGCTQSSCSSELFLFDSGKLQWELIQSKDSPGPRHSHSSILANSKMIIYGGFDGSDYLSDVFCFDIGTRVWQKLSISGVQIPPRANHAAVLLNNKMYVFGGQSSSGVLNDAYVIDLGTLKCQKILNYSLAIKGHAALCVENKILLIGGSSPSGPLKEDEAVSSINIDKLVLGESSKPPEVQSEPVKKYISEHPITSSSSKSSSSLNTTLTPSPSSNSSSISSASNQSVQQTPLASTVPSSSPSWSAQQRPKTGSVPPSPRDNQKSTTSAPISSSPSPSPTTSTSLSPSTASTTSLRDSKAIEGQLQHTRDPPPISHDARKSILLPPSEASNQSSVPQPSRDTQSSTELSASYQPIRDSQPVRDTRAPASYQPARDSQPTRDIPSPSEVSIQQQQIDSRKSIREVTKSTAGPIQAAPSPSLLPPTYGVTDREKTLQDEVNLLKEKLAFANDKIEQLERKIAILELDKKAPQPAYGKAPPAPPPPPPMKMKALPSKSSGMQLADALAGAKLKPAEEVVAHASKDTKESAKNGNAMSIALLAVTQRNRLRATSSKNIPEKRPERPQVDNPIQTLRGGLRKGNTRNQPEKR